MKLKARIAVAVFKLMELTRGRNLANYWAWEMTPWPMAVPSWTQIRVGLAMALRLDFVARAYIRKVERIEREATS